MKQNEFVRLAFREYGFLIARKEKITFKQWAARIAGAYDTRESRRVYNALNLLDGGVRKNIFGGLVLWMN